MSDAGARITDRELLLELVREVRALRLEVAALRKERQQPLAPEPLTAILGRSAGACRELLRRDDRAGGGLRQLGEKQGRRLVFEREAVKAYFARSVAPCHNPEAEPRHQAADEARIGGVS